MDDERFKEVIAILCNTPLQKDKLARVVAALAAVIKHGGRKVEDALEEHLYQIARIDALYPFFS